MDRKELRIRMGLFAEEVISKVDLDEVQGNFNLGTELRRAGYRVVGAGAYGTVIKHPELDMVLKICTDQYDGYPAFARWAEVNRPANVVDIVYTCRVNESLFLAAMPVYSAVESGTKYEYMIDNINQNVPRGEYECEIRDALDRVLDALGDYACRDTHRGNWLIDKDGKLLISDPLSGIHTYRTTTAEAEAAALGMKYKRQQTEQLDLYLVVELPTEADFEYWDDGWEPEPLPVINMHDMMAMNFERRLDWRVDPYAIGRPAAFDNIKRASFKIGGVRCIKPRPFQPMQLQKVGKYGFQCGR